MALNFKTFMSRPYGGPFKIIHTHNLQDGFVFFPYDQEHPWVTAEWDTLKS